MPAGIKVGPYTGWSNSVSLYAEDVQVKVVVVPAIGGRVAHYSLNGDNIIFENSESFGKTLSDHQMVQKMLAESVAGIHAGNLMTLHCASMLEQGKTKEARPYSSMTKNHVARLLCKVLDDAIQLHGGLGYSEDMPFSIWYRAARAARIADGPDEVHDVVVARDFLRGALETLI